MIQRKTHLDSLAIGLLIACCAFWGLQQILIKTTVAEVPPMWQASIRMVGATALLWVWCLAAACRCSSATARCRPGLLAGLLFAGRVQLHLPGAAEHQRVAAHGVSLHRALLGVGAAAALGAGRAAAAASSGLGLLLAFAGVVLAFSEGFGHMQLVAAGAATPWPWRPACCGA